MIEVDQLRHRSSALRVEPRQHLPRADRAYTETLFAACAEVMTAIVRLPKPVIARVHGIACRSPCVVVIPRRGR